MVRLLLPLLFFVHALLFSYSHASDPLQVIPSKKTYGPDGPWNAVSVKLGDPGQNIDLYPGGVFESHIFTNVLCDRVNVKPCGSGGLYTPENSTTLDSTSIGLPVTDGVQGQWSQGAQALAVTGASHAMDNLIISGVGQNSDTTVANLSMILYPNISTVYPDGSRYPPQVGLMSLGAPNPNQTFPQDSGPAINASLIPTYLQETKVIGSASFGLHIGSAALNLPLSLWFGGYDAMRISGQVSAHSYSPDPSNQFNLDLFDIGVGVDNGGSPFSYAKKDGLLAAGNSSISNSIPIDMNPAAPYLTLPNSTCAAITKDLPVTYNATYELYFWNVQDPQYTRIVTSPTYLSFTFDNNFIVKVPFKLLNLTLDAPLISTPTQYFPCQPPQAPGKTTYSLGRAFLQAAFLGVYWTDNGQWFLAQAPGPGVGTVPQQKPVTSPSLPATPDNWADTWKSVWTPLPISASSSGAPAATTSSANQLSGGAYAGIAIGAVAAVLIGLAVGFFIYRRRRSRTSSIPSLSALLPGHKDAKSGQPHEFKEGSPQYVTTNEPQEMDTTDAQHAPSELGTMERSELSGVERYEMEQPSRRPTGV